MSCDNFEPDVRLTLIGTFSSDDFIYLDSLSQFRARFSNCIPRHRGVLSCTTLESDMPPLHPAPPQCHMHISTFGHRVMLSASNFPVLQDTQFSLRHASALQSLTSLILYIVLYSVHRYLGKSCQRPNVLCVCIKHLGGLVLRISVLRGETKSTRTLAFQ